MKRKGKIYYNELEKHFKCFLEDFLNECFPNLKYIEKPWETDKGGDDGGRDVNVKFRYNDRNFKLYFEWKGNDCSIKNNINKSDGNLACKMLEVLSRDRANVYCIVSRNKEKGQWLERTIEDLNEKYNVQFMFWSPACLNFKECVQLFPKWWSKLYKSESSTNSIIKKEQLLKLVREEFVNNNEEALRKRGKSEEYKGIIPDGDKFREVVYEDKIVKKIERDIESIKNQLNFRKK